MKITGTMSSITFDMEDGHIMKAKGEMLINKTFAVDKSTIKQWEPPFENEQLSEEDVEEIICLVLSQVSYCLPFSIRSSILQCRVLLSFNKVVAEALLISRWRCSKS